MNSDKASNPFTDAARLADLENQILPDYLQSERWFGGKSKGPARVRVVDWVALDAAQEDRQLVLCFLDVQFEDGHTHAYSMPLTFKSSGELIRHDGPMLASTAAELLRVIADKRALKTERGRLRGYTTSAFAMPAKGLPEPDPLLKAEQSNTNLRFDEQWMMKLIRRLEPGPNPELEIGEFLLEHTSFRRVPALVGWIEYERPGLEHTTLAILQDYVPSQCNGWEQALASLPPYLSAVVEKDKLDANIGPFAAAAELLGRHTAELHEALASATAAHPFVPEALGAEDIDAIKQRVRENFDKNEPGLRRLAEEGGSLSVQAAKLLQHAPALRARVEGFQLVVPALKTRVHGDYHLGQVLWTGDDYWLIDFEGEPTRPLPERRAKHSPLKDIAGMIRSFEYAAQAVLPMQTASASPLKPAMQLACRTWCDVSIDAFMRGYRAAADSADFLPHDQDAFQALLDFYVLDKVIYELYYELNNRPDWVGIPLAGALRML